MTGRVWVQSDVVITEKNFDYDLSSFEVVTPNGTWNVVPDDLECMEEIVKALDNGDSVIGCEDGQGNTIY